MNDLELHVESLESRRLMAGDVAVRLAGNDLIIEGDSLDNDSHSRLTSEQF